MKLNLRRGCWRGDATEMRVEMTRLGGNVMRRFVRGSRLSSSFLLAVASLVVVVVVLTWPAGDSRPGATQSRPTKIFGDIQNAGAGWSSTTDPMTDGASMGLANIAGSAGYAVPLPNVSLASAANVQNSWLGAEAPTQGLLPASPRPAVAVGYASGVLVTIVPWQYGPNAPAFSQVQALASYQLAAKDPGSSQIQMTVGSVSGIPVREIPTNVGGQGNPASVEFQLGNSSADAMTVTVLGRQPLSSLEGVASSIIGSWQASNAGSTPSP